MKIEEKVSIIIVSYNTCKMTLDCLNSLYNETKLIEYEVIVLDNNSSDGSAEAIEKNFPELTLIKYKENLGFSEGNNYCSKIATSNLLLLLNPDTIVLNNAIKKLVDFSKEYPSAGIWGGRTLFANKALNPKSCWNKITPWSLFFRATGLAAIFSNNSFINSEELGGWQRDSVKKVDIVSGCFFLIKKSLWDELKGFDKRFFMYGEEADLCLRAKKIGYTPMVTNTAEIIHYGGASEKKRAGKLIKLLKAKIQLIRNHWHPLTKEFGVFLVMLWPFSRYIATKFKLFFDKTDAATENYYVWKEVWLDKNNWLKGYY
jgi:GT2 family glycosyltransferase